MAGWNQQRNAGLPEGAGNPLSSNPPLAHPSWNPAGTIPGPTIARGVEAWSHRQASQFKLVDGNQVWTWQSAVFDLRPGAVPPSQTATPAVPINHEAALGLSVYATLIIGSKSGAYPPAAIPDMTMAYWEDGNNSDTSSIMRLTQDIDITDIMQAGGTRTTEPFGASGFDVTPSMPGMRFWRFGFRLTVAGAAPLAYDLYMQFVVH